MTDDKVGPATSRDEAGGQEEGIGAVAWLAQKLWEHADSHRMSGRYAEAEEFRKASLRLIEQLGGSLGRDRAGGREDEGRSSGRAV